MAVRNLFSKRAAQQQRTKPDVFRYDDLPEHVRVQIVHVWDEVIEDGYPYQWQGNIWDDLVRFMRKELGVFFLTQDQRLGARNEYVLAFMQCDLSQGLDMLELSCQIMTDYCSQWQYHRRNDSSDLVREGLQEINDRLRFAAIGYEYTNGQIIRVDSTFLHANAVLPALELLSQEPLFAGAESEFLEAHKRYRENEAGPALVECCKSFESVMKAICQKRGWTYDKNKDAAAKLVEVCMSHNLIPTYWQSHFTGLRTILESALPTPRNRQGGHGVGATPTNVPIELARYVLHMTASTLLFLAEADARLH